LARKFRNGLIETRLQLQEADREKITVEDSELAEELAERIKRVGAKSQEEFEGLIRAQGISMDAIKKRLKDSLRMSKVVRRKVALRISVTEVEIDRYFEANRPKLETGRGSRSATSCTGKSTRPGTRRGSRRSSSARSSRCGSEAISY